MRRRFPQFFRACLGLLAIASALAASADEPYGRHQFEPDVRSHWSFQPLRRPDAPPAAGASGRNPIDIFIRQGLTAAGLEPAGPADRAVLLRRVYFDLIGLPPTPAELDEFLTDTSSDAYERVVDRLLSRPEYGQR